MRNHLRNAVERCKKATAIVFPMCVLTASLPAQTLRVTSPADGGVVYSGRTFVVKVEATPGAFKSVAVIGDYPLERPAGLLYAPPYQFTMRVPPTAASHVYHLSVVGATTTGKGVDADITVDVERHDPPVRVRNEIHTLDLNYVGESYLLQVTGTFADGSEVTLTYSSLTTYSSDNPAVATVDHVGLVTAVSPGVTKITIANNGKSVVVPVKVEDRKSP